MDLCPCSYHGDSSLLIGHNSEYFILFYYFFIVLFLFNFIKCFILFSFAGTMVRVPCFLIALYEYHGKIASVIVDLFVRHHY